MRHRVVFTDETIRREAIDLLAPTCDVHVMSAYPSEDALASACVDAHAILARLGTVTRRVIDSAPHLRIIARHGVGVDAVDLDAATERGIVVTTTGSVNAAAVAEYTFALLLALVRKIVAADQGMRRGEWSRGAQVGMELDGRTLGIVGLGAIGRRVARQAIGFGMQVLACDPALSSVDDEPIELVPLPTLLARSDIVTLHTRLTPTTAKLIDAAALAAMKPGAFLINTSRGEIIDETALAEALRSGALAGAALDTFASEPLSPDSPLRQMPALLLSPHVAGQSDAALLRVAITAAQCILDELSGRRPGFIYNPQAYEARAVRARAGVR